MSAPASVGYATESLSDYFGIPTAIPDLEHSALFHRAYNLIYNEWFRDENLIDSVPINKGDGPDSPLDYPLQRRGKRHDYFTSCLPWPQKGESVSIPLGNSAPVTGIGKINQTFDSSNTAVYETDGSATATYLNSTALNHFENPNAVTHLEEDPTNLGFPNIRADLSEATAATINQLRQAFQLQRLYERDARGGTRYTEIIKAHFQVTSPDARLQRPEYLGGGTSNININPVAQTSGAFDTALTPQGTLAAYGTGEIRGHGFTKSFTEHSVILGFACVRADLTYQNGLDRMWSRSDRFSFYWPALSHIGEQAVLNQEIFAQLPTNLNPDGTPINLDAFGYQERFAEYRYKPSKITGKFRSNDPQTLDSWHLAQNFDNLPTLNQTFIEENPPVDRVIVVQDEPQFLFDSYIELRCARPMPVYSVPGLIDHF